MLGRAIRIEGAEFQAIDKGTLMEDISEILNKARLRGQETRLPYAGALLPVEAELLMCSQPSARLVDVRTRAEWDYVGKVPGSVQLEWQTYPNSQPNPAFLEQLKAQVAADSIVMFLCRSGARSHAAAIAAAGVGYAHAYNILQGFEGDKDARGHRSSVGGWKFAGLPWIQN
jgi:rhodanese-related sulfurtransferase